MKNKDLVVHYNGFQKNRSLFFWSAILFVLLNMLDAVLTTCLTLNGYAVVEANPIMNYLLSKWGWIGFWLYKFFVSIFIVLTVKFIFPFSYKLSVKDSKIGFFAKKANAAAIMGGLCVGFGIIMSYMMFLFLMPRGT